MSDTSIMSVGDLIDTAFGDPDVNTVNFKLIQTILLLIARQLSILERYVAVKIGYPIVTSSGSRLSIREVKLHAVVPKKDKKRKKGAKASDEKEYVTLDDKTTKKFKGKKREEDTTSARKHDDSYDKSSVDKEYRDKSAADKSYRKKSDKHKEKEELSFDEDYADDKRSVSSKVKPHKGETSKRTGDLESDTEGDHKSYKTSGKSPEDKKYTQERDEDEKQERREKRERRQSKESEGRASIQSRDGTFRKDERDQRREKGELSDKYNADDSRSLRGKSPRDKSQRDRSSRGRSPTSSPSERDELSINYPMSEEKPGKYSTQERSEDGRRGGKAEDSRSVDKYEDGEDDGRAEKSGRYADKSGKVRSRSEKDEDGEDGRRGEKSGRYADKSGKERSRSEKDEGGEDGGRGKKSGRYADKSYKSRSEKDGTEKGYDKKSGKFLNSEEDFGSSGTSLESEQQSKRSYDKQDSKASKRTTDKEGKTEKGGTKTDKASLKGADTRVSRSATTDSKRKKYQHLLEKLEEERERVLRVIHQRTDSREEHSRTPTPMASLSSTDLQQEKLLIVEKISPDSKGAESSKEKGRQHAKEAPRISVVTQDQFQQLQQNVKELEEKFGPLDIPLLDDLRKGVRLSDALAGLQLATRLDATEKALGRMLNIMTDIAMQTPGVNVKSFTDLREGYGETVIKLRQTESQYKFRTGPTTVLRVEIGDKPGWVSNTGADTESKMKTISSKPSETTSVVSAPISVAVIEAPDDTGSVQTGGLWDVTKKNYVTAQEMETAIQGVYDDYTTMLNNWTNRTSQKADAAYQMCTKMERELAKNLVIEKKMNELEEKIQSYVERINILDTGLSTQMINYQEQLTQMQHDLETGLDNMAEALATQTGDTEAMGELNQNFTILQCDFDRTRVMQKDLSDIQEAFAIDLTALKKEIEMLREVKSDRDEVADALRDKAGLSALNGLVAQVQFDAVQGDLEKRIRHAYDKFNSQEVVWQRAIDDLIREINEKATVQQVDTLREEIQSKINVQKEKLDFMLDILGEPSAAAVKRQLFRDTDCLSCSTPAHMRMGELGAPEPVGPEPSLAYKKAAGEGIRVGKAVGDGDHVPCIPGLPPPHPIDPRAEICTRYCGGRHTVFSHAFTRAAPTQLPDINISQLTRETKTVIGDDGKVYKVEVNKKPCHPCNVPKTPVKDDYIPEREQSTRKSSSSMGTPSDLRVYSDLLTSNRCKGTDTPPACNE